MAQVEEPGLRGVDARSRGGLGVLTGCGVHSVRHYTNIDIALTGFRKLDDPSGDYFLGDVGSACNSRTSHSNAMPKQLASAGC
jgi:hypothetical protein